MAARQAGLTAAARELGNTPAGIAALEGSGFPQELLALLRRGLDLFPGREDRVPGHRQPALTGGMEHLPRRSDATTLNRVGELLDTPETKLTAGVVADLDLGHGHRPLGLGRGETLQLPDPKR